MGLPLFASSIFQQEGDKKAPERAAFFIPQTSLFIKKTGGGEVDGRLLSYLLLDPVKPGAHSHRFNVADPVDAGEIAPWFTQGLVETSLELLQMMMMII